MSNYYYWCITPEGKWLFHVGWSQGRGDLVWRMAIYALITGDVDVIKACIKLLNGRKRWPDLLNMDNDSRNMIEYWLYKVIHKLGLRADKKAKPQNRMSRDPFIMLTCAIYWHQYEMIRDLKIPWRINNPSLWFWKKYLETNDKLFKLKYESWTKFSINISSIFGFKGYVKSLLAWRAFIARSYEVKGHLIDYIPYWNYANRLLCGDIIDEQDVKSYASSDGWIWNADTPKDNPQWLGEGEPIYLDKEYLNFVYENRNW